MSFFPPTTQRRLQKIPRVASIWECDRRSLSGMDSNLATDHHERESECILWVDGAEGVVRAMEVVSADTGPEALVRTLLKAIENPQTPGDPAIPEKILVKDREIQFFLRGVLQNLGITVDYTPHLPLIDEIFRSFAAIKQHQPPNCPPAYLNLLKQVSETIWNHAPWNLLSDQDILAVEINHWDVGTVYLCVMGMLGEEFGVIIYRSLESLQQFRQTILENKSMESLEKAFMAQDCWFINYEPQEGVDWTKTENVSLEDLDFSEISPIFGSIHPFEGMRPFLDEEEVCTIYVALQALDKFCQRSDLEQEITEKLTESYEIEILPETGVRQTVEVKVSTMPELTEDLLSVAELTDNEEEADSPLYQIPIEDDLIPAGSFISFRTMPRELIEMVTQDPKVYYQPIDQQHGNLESLPVILIQTSRPKAKKIIDTIVAEQGLTHLYFNQGQDPLLGIVYDLTILETKQKNFYLLTENIKEDSDEVSPIEKWQQLCQENQGICTLILAMGVTGASRGKPKLQDILAVFEIFLVRADNDLNLLSLTEEI